MAYFCCLLLQSNRAILCADIAGGILRIRDTVFYKRTVRPIVSALANFAWKIERGFYVGLAILFFVLSAIDIMYFNVLDGIEKRTFDVMMQNRIIAPMADNDIAFVDIDEISLQMLQEDYGSYPWSRSVMESVLRTLIGSGAKAVVFDVVFSSAGKDAIGDENFSKLFASADNVYGASIYFPPSSGARDTFVTAMSEIPGVEMMAGGDNGARHPFVLPYFNDMLSSRKNSLGVINMEPEEDGILRRGIIQFQTNDGWAIRSLPASAALDMGFSLPNEDRILVNWKYGYEYKNTSSIYDVYMASLGEDLIGVPDAAVPGGYAYIARDEYLQRFAGKVIFVGSTAPALFDKTATSLKPVHEGLYVLANIFDNIKNDDYYRELPSWLYVAIAWGMILLVYRSIRVDTRHDNLDIIRAMMESFAFVALSYLIMNVSTFYVDIATPLAFSMIYFALSFSFAYVVQMAKHCDTLVSGKFDVGSHVDVTFAVLKINGGADATDLVRDSIMLKIKHNTNAAIVEEIFHGSFLLESAMSDVVICYWIRDRVRTDDIIGKEFCALKNHCMQIGANVDVVRDDISFDVSHGGEWKSVVSGFVSRYFSGKLASNMDL